MKTDQFGRPIGDGISEGVVDNDWIKNDDGLEEDTNKEVSKDTSNEDQNQYDFSEESFNKQFETRDDASFDTQNLDENQSETDNDDFEKVEEISEDTREFDAKNLPAPKIYREKLDQMYKTMEMQNLQILGLSKLVEKLNDNIEDLKKPAKKEDENRIDENVSEINKSESNDSKSTTVNEDKLEKNKIVLTPLGSLMLMLIFIVIFYLIMKFFLNIDLLELISF